MNTQRNPRKSAMMDMLLMVLYLGKGMTALRHFRRWGRIACVLFLVTGVAWLCGYLFFRPQPGDTAPPAQEVLLIAVGITAVAAAVAALLLWIRIGYFRARFALKDTRITAFCQVCGQEMGVNRKGVRRLIEMADDPEHKVLWAWTEDCADRIERDQQDALKFCWSCGSHAEGGQCKACDLCLDLFRRRPGVLSKNGRPEDAVAEVKDFLAGRL